MRAVQTFILRLLVDPAEPDVLRGAVEPVPEGESRSFVGEEELLALLRSATRPASEAPATPGPANSGRGERDIA